MEHEHRSDRFTAIEDQYAGYEVYDRNGEKIGKVDDLFVDESERPEYIGVKRGFFGLEGTSLIPWELARVDKEGHRIEVSVEKARVKEGPSFNDDRDISAEYEERVRSHYGLGAMQGAAERGRYGDYYAGEERTGEVGPGLRMGDTETGEFRGHGRHQEGVNQPGDDLEDEDELRVPKRREEVHVERVPVEGREASGAEIGEDEVFMPVTEEEVVVEKRPEVKEEIRVRKDVVQEEELVEEDVRREEVDIDDQTEQRGRGLGRDAGRTTDLDDEARRRRGR